MKQTPVPTIAKVCVLLIPNFLVILLDLLPGKPWPLAFSNLLGMLPVWDRCESGARTPLLLLLAGWRGRRKLYRPREWQGLRGGAILEA